MPGKPKFDPNQPFEVVEGPAQGAKPKFDPSQPFEAVGEPVPSAPPPDMGAGTAFARGAGQGVTLGWGDELQAGVGAGLDAVGLGADLQGQSFYERYKAYRDAERAKDSQASAQQPIANTAGAVAGGALLPAGALSGARTVGQVARTSGILGGAAGLGRSEADTAQGMLADTAIGAGTGALVGGAAAGIPGAAAGALRSRNAAKAAEQWLEPNAIGSNILPLVRPQSASPVQSLVGQFMGNAASTAVGSLLGGVPGGVASNIAYQVASSPGARQAASRAVQGASASIGKALTDPRFAQALQSASERGPQAVAALHWILQQQNPNYRSKTIEEPAPDTGVER